MASLLDRARELLAPRTVGRLTAIDGLRAVAAMWVLLHHFHGAIAGDRDALWSAPVESFFDHGWAGVQIFFVLSGFVISHSLRGHAVTWSFFGRFAARRSMRLDPPYWIIIFASLGVMIATHSDKLARVDAWVVLANMLYLDNLLELPSLVAVGWTLCLELQFYLVLVALLGLVQLLVRRGALRESTARAIVFAPLALLSVLIFSGVVPFPLRGLFITHWSLFFLGVLVRWSLDRPETTPWLFALVVLQLGSIVHRWDAGPLVGSATALLIWALGRTDRLETALSGRITQFLGQISYSLYLVHPLLGNRVLRRITASFVPPPSGLTAIALLVGATLLCIAASTVFYLLVEQPSQQLSKRIRLVPRRAAAKAAIAPTA